MEIANFEDLLQAARVQPEPQRLLFVFAQAELPEDCTPEQKANFEAGQGGALVPLMSVDKLPADLATFDALVEESLAHAPKWAVVFVAGLSGSNGQPPGSAETERALERMLASVKAGQFGAFLPFDRMGVPVAID